MDVKIEHLQQWIGRTETRHDTVTATPFAALAATLDQEPSLPPPGTSLPPLWHWLYFLPLHRQSELGPDGHAARGGFLPPVPLPRRMWAGGRLTFEKDLRVGEAISRTSTVASVSAKEGRSGNLVFVQVRHEIANDSGIAVTEEHDIVYRDNPAPGSAAPAPRPAPTGARWVQQIEADAVMLFRYSALTFNPHRIHFDRRYVTEVEGYPGLIVHGPLIATLLIELVRRELPERHIGRFEFRAVRPIFDHTSFSVCGTPDQDGRTIRLWAQDSDGFLCMEATAILD